MNEAHTASDLLAAAMGEYMAERRPTPVITLTEVCEATGLSMFMAAGVMNELVDAGTAEEEVPGGSWQLPTADTAEWLPLR